MADPYAVLHPLLVVRNNNPPGSEMLLYVPPESRLVVRPMPSPQDVGVTPALLVKVMPSFFHAWWYVTRAKWRGASEATAWRIIDTKTAGRLYHLRLLAGALP
jgi:hypothetical protein